MGQRSGDQISLAEGLALQRIEEGQTNSGLLYGGYPCRMASDIDWDLQERGLAVLSIRLTHDVRRRRVTGVTRPRRLLPRSRTGRGCL